MTLLVVEGFVPPAMVRKRPVTSLADLTTGGDCHCK